MMKTRTLKIRDVGLVKTGKTPPTKNAEFFGNDFEFITPSDIEEFDIRKNFQATRGLSIAGSKHLKNYMLPKNSICYVCIGSTIGKICMTKLNCFSNQQLNTLIPFSQFDANYLFYKLRSITPLIQSIGQGKGAGKGIINKSEFEKLDIEIFDSFEIQKKVGGCLANYDELIDINCRKIQMLESIAKLIYNEWFVKFKFSGHEKVKMVDSELGEIPEGWEVKKIYDIVDIQKGLSYKSENLVDDGKIAFVNLKCFERGGGFRYDGVKRFEGDFKEKHVVKCGDIVVAVTDMTQNREIVARAARIPRMNEENIIISMDVVKMNPKNGLDKSWLFGLLNYSSFGIKMKEFANGVNVLHLKSEPMGEYWFVMPDQKTIEAYSQIVSRIYQEIDNLQLKNMNLATTRDLLLPKLISGELDVSELDIKVSEVEV